MRLIPRFCAIGLLVCNDVVDGYTNIVMKATRLPSRSCRPWHTWKLCRFVKDQGKLVISVSLLPLVGFHLCALTTFAKSHYLIWFNLPGAHLESLLLEETGTVLCVLRKLF